MSNQRRRPKNEVFIAPAVSAFSSLGTRFRTTTGNLQSFKGRAHRQLGHKPIDLYDRLSRPVHRMASERGLRHGVVQPLTRLSKFAFSSISLHASRYNSSGRPPAHKFNNLVLGCPFGSVLISRWIEVGVESAYDGRSIP